MEFSIQGTYTLILNDGKARTLFSLQDFFRLVEEKVGTEASRWLENFISELDSLANETEAKAAAEVDTDLRNYEASLEADASAFQELQEICDSIEADYIRETGRNRLAALRPWWKRVQEMREIIRNRM